MSIIEQIKQRIPSINDKQLEVIEATEGPVLVIAGPGTGKTLTLALRTMHLIMSGKAEPKNILVTTFTEKAAFELRDRISQIAHILDYKGQLHELNIGTIHSICNKLIGKNINHTPLKRNYVVLDGLTQILFLYENFDEIFAPCKNDGLFLKKWKTKWSTIKEVSGYFDKISEELIDTTKMLSSNNEFLKTLAECYLRYRRAQYTKNSVDFANLQTIFLSLLKEEKTKLLVKKDIRYVMVDEYQDTNFVQQQIFLMFASPTNNICVVGDDDQALYRFRGATVRNILEFPSFFQNCKQVKLVLNYRSHNGIITKYNTFMKSIDWEGFRFDKEIKPDPNILFPDYPAVFSIWGSGEVDEGERFANLVEFLKKYSIIEDYSDVALLLSSVRHNNSHQYLQALDRLNIPYFAPRAKAYFENNEVQELIACFAVIFGFYGKVIEDFPEKEYVENSILLLRRFIGKELSGYITRKVKQLEDLKEGSLNLTILDYFFQIMAYEPFNAYLKDERCARNLAIFSGLISTFQGYYRLSVITARNKEYIKFFLFGSFIHFLLQGGMDDYEDPDNPIPKGYVQVMTVHQSKGLEFPIVAVGSLDKMYRVQKQVDKDLQPFSERGLFENYDQMTIFDRMRHFYVAFSRAQKILVLTTNETPQNWLSSIWDGLDQWPFIRTKTLMAQRFTSKPQFVPKKSYSLSSIDSYEICPQQYLFYRKFAFQPSRSGQMLFGTLVHQTIEDIHRQIIERGNTSIDQFTIEKWFENNYRTLLMSGLRPLIAQQKENALKQVINYYQQNNDLFGKLKEAEVDVSVEKSDYILEGKIDLLLGNDNKYEILDFKTMTKPSASDPMISSYFKQLCLYSYILKERYGKTAERLYIYWTSEKTRKEALMELKFSPDQIEYAGEHFNAIVNKIKKCEFHIVNPPDYHKVCKDCDFRYYCNSQGVIKAEKLKTVP